MKKEIGTLVAALLAWVWITPAPALFLDDARTVEVVGKALTQGSWRMEDSDSGGRGCINSFGSFCTGFTFPNTKRGQLIQHRTLLDVELYQNVAGWLGPQFSVLDKLGYRLRLKYFYDGLYDYGPLQYRTPRFYTEPNDRQGVINARHLNTQKDPLWNAYLDLSKDPVFLRVGRQDLSWGETDGFRLLDQIEPLDNRFGFPLVEDLDDRRIPLWMVRPTINLGTLGPLSNLAIDGYWVPGTIDNEVSPIAPSGNPFAAPNPPGLAVITRPSKNLGNSRGGGRILGTIANQVTFSIGHYVTFNDFPSARLRVDNVALQRVPDVGVVAIPTAAFLVDFYQQQITGASATFALPFDPYTIIRMEAAHFWDERVFSKAENVTAALDRFNAGARPAIANLPTKNIMRWMIGFDRNVWIRWLNPQNTFFVSAQYFHTNIFNFDRDLANPVAGNSTFGPVQTPLGTVHAADFNFVPRKNDEIFLTYFVNTLVWHGTITPGVFGAYDTRGVHAVVPSITYQLGTNVQLVLKYSVITGPFANLGFFRDRDQLVFRVQYNLS